METRQHHFIPERLRNPNYKFYLIRKGKKTPLEKRWNKEGGNNYYFFEKKLTSHLLKGGNVGLCCGFSNVVVVDFDDAQYQMFKNVHLPLTFTVKSAGKGLQHHYYNFEGVKFRKIPIGMTPRLADVQFWENDRSSSGMVCPPSRIAGKAYEVVVDVPIATLTMEVLKRCFKLESLKTPRKRPRTGDYETGDNPYLVRKCVEKLDGMGLLRGCTSRHFTCPFHSSHGGSCLWVTPQGSLYCFHCRFSGSLEWFLKEVGECKKD